MISYAFKYLILQHHGYSLGTLLILSFTLCKINVGKELTSVLNTAIINIMCTVITVIYRVMWGRPFPKLYCLYTVLKLSKLCLNQIVLGTTIQMYRSDWPWQ